MKFDIIKYIRDISLIANNLFIYASWIIYSDMNYLCWMQYYAVIPQMLICIIVKCKFF